MERSCCEVIGPGPAYHSAGVHKSYIRLNKTKDAERTLSMKNIRNADIYMRVGSNAQTTLLWNKPHFPTTKYTWRAAEAQKQSRLIPLTRSTVPTCVMRAGQTPNFPQLGPVLIHAAVLHVCYTAAAAVTEMDLDQTPGKLNLHRKVHQEQGYEVSCSGTV